MARRNKTRYTILGTLTIRSMSGYDIKKFIQNTISHFWSESYGQIYPTLRTLTDEGLVSRSTEPQTGRPDKHMYEITEAGRSALRDWLEQPADPEVRRAEFLLKLFFGSEISADVNIEHLRQKRREAEETLRACRAAYEEVTGRSLEQAPGYPYWLLNIRAGIIFSEATIAWCDEAEASLRNHTAPSSEQSES